jgi:hypothetical protein
MGALILLVLCSRSADVRGNDEDGRQELGRSGKNWKMEQPVALRRKVLQGQMQGYVNFRGPILNSIKFFEVGRTGNTQTKAQMVASQTAAAAKKPGRCCYRDLIRRFQIDISLWEHRARDDHQLFSNHRCRTGNVLLFGGPNVLQMFVKENGSGVLRGRY